ncbi:MAG: hypothetical protein HY295_04335 [Thaumarchaeota archaeon]|nr:hypothetical protein [Nitrososphaerota archaeon]
MTAEEALKITREEAEKEKKESREKTENKPKPSESNSQVDLYFQDLPNINVKDACEKFLDLMKDLVTEAHTQFP